MGEDEICAWRFDPEQLRRGDVVLEQGGRWYSWIIRKLTRGQYSHALVYVGNGDFIEAVKHGVHVISYRRVYIVDPGRWKLLRLGDEGVASRAADHARNLAHKHYNVRGAVGTLLPLRQNEDRTKLFCSEVVAEAYARAGVTLVEGVRIAKITPNMLDQRSVLTPVTPLPLVETRVPRQERIVFEDRDAAYEGSPADVDRNASQLAFGAVREEAEMLVQKLGVTQTPGNLQELLDMLRQLQAKTNDSQVAPLADSTHKALDSVGYYTLLTAHAREVEGYLTATLSLMRSGALPETERLATLKEMTSLANSYLQSQARHAENAAWFGAAQTSSASPLWTHLAKMHTENAAWFSHVAELANQVADACSTLEGSTSASH